MTQYDGLLIPALAIALLLYWHWRSDNSFDLSYLVCTDGKVNDKKFARTTALAVTTWGFYWLCYTGKMTEVYFFGYGTLWVGNAAIDKWQWLSSEKEKKNAT